MEIISYLKGKKAQADVKEVQKVIGQDSYKNGIRDIVDVWVDADERISKLEQKHENDKLNDRIESLTELVAINLAKQHLLIGMQANKQRTDHNQLVFQDFDTTSDYVPTKSKNVQLTPKGIKPTNALANAEVVLKPEPAHQLMKLFVQTAHSNANGLTIPLAIADIQHTEGVTVTGANVSLTKKDAEYNVYESEGFIRFNPLITSESYTLNSALYNGTLQSANVIYYYALSEDGILFGEYQRLLPGSVLSNHVSIKIVFKNTVVSDGSKSYAAAKLTTTEHTVVADGSSKLKTSYARSLEKDETWEGEGTVLKHQVEMSEWKKFVNFTV